MQAKFVSAITCLSILTSVNAQYYDNVYSRNVGANYHDLSERDLSDLTQLSRRDLEGLTARDPSFKSFIHKIGHGIKEGAHKIGHGVGKVGGAVGKEAIQNAPQIVEAAQKLHHRDTFQLGLDVYARSLEEIEAREAEPDSDEDMLFGVYAREAEMDGDEFAIFAREVYADPEIFDYGY